MENHGLRQADAYLEGLRAKLETLKELPTMGAPWRRGSSIRTVLYGKHRIFYREVEEGLEVGRFLRQERSFVARIERFELVSGQREGSSERISSPDKASQ